MSNDPHQILARLNSGESLMIFIDKAALTQQVRQLFKSELPSVVKEQTHGN